jgi:hypothetical protein
MDAGKNKTEQSDASILEKYSTEATQFYGKSEQWQADIKDEFVKITSYLGDPLERGIDNSTRKAHTQALQNAGFDNQTC